MGTPLPPIIFLFNSAMVGAALGAFACKAVELVNWNLPVILWKGNGTSQQVSVGISANSKPQLPPEHVALGKPMIPQGTC